MVQIAPKTFNVFNENENNDVKMIFPSNIANHIAIAISVKIITIRYFFKIIQPYNDTVLMFISFLPEKLPHTISEKLCMWSEPCKLELFVLKSTYKQ